MSSLDLRDSKTTEVSTNVNKVALVVGVNGSVNSTYSAPLKYAEHDAYEIAWTLQQPECNFTLLESALRGKEANTWNTRRAVIKLAQKRSAQDFLLFYFCGHALPMKTKGDRKDIYFLTHDFNEDDVQADPTMYLSMRWLWDILYQQSEAGRVLLILDCCYAGNMINAGIDPFQIDLRKLMEEWYQGSSEREQKDRQRLILMSTGYDTLSQEKDGHGLMTGLLVPALRGEVAEVLDDDGQVDIHSLYKYLLNNMGEQPPNLSGEFGPYNCILAVHSNPPARLRQKAKENELRNEVERGILSELLRLHAAIQHTQPFDHSLSYDASFSDLNLEKVAEFLKQERVQQEKAFQPGLSYQDQLLRFGFLQQSSPTYGALLCFGQNPWQWVSGAITRCVAWDGNVNSDRMEDSREFKGNLLEQFELSRDFLRKHLRLSRVISREGSTEEWEIPLRVLDEALANALVHREYANRTDPIRVEVFDGRIEISSPGTLPPPMTEKLLLAKHKSYPRNPQIAGIFYLYGYIEKFGTGILRMQRFMKDAGLLEPEFKLDEDQTITVVLHRPKQILSDELIHQMNVNPTKFRRAMLSAYNVSEVKLLCADLGVRYDDLEGNALVGKIQSLMDYFMRRGQYEKIVRRVLSDRPNLIDELRDSSIVNDMSQFREEQAVSISQRPAPTRQKKSTSKQQSKSSTSSQASSSERVMLQSNKEKLQRIRDFILYEKNLREISKNDLNMLISQLREIAKDINDLRSMPLAYITMKSIDEVEELIMRVITNFYITLDLLEQGKRARNKHAFYEKLYENEQPLAEIIEYFSIDEA